MFPVIFELDLAVFSKKKKQKKKKKKKKHTHTNTKKTRYLSMRNLAKDAFLYYQCLASVEVRYTCFC